MNVLVTGGTGFIGGHLVKRLNDEGFKVHVIDHERNNDHVIRHDGVEYHTFDLYEIKEVKRLFELVDFGVVFHLAAEIDVNESERKRYKYFKNNVLASGHLIKLMREKNVNNMIFVSSCAVYGDQVENPIKEDHKTEPFNYYGITKLDNEIQLQRSGLDYVILRLFNVVGSDRVNGENHKVENHLIPYIVDQVENNEVVKVRGYGVNTKDGYCERDYVHVVDVVDALIRSMLFILEKNDSEIFNIGSGKAKSVFDVLIEMKKIYDTNIEFDHGDQGKADVPSIYADIKKANMLLGWIPTKSLKDMITDHIEWKRNKENGI